VGIDEAHNPGGRRESARYHPLQNFRESLQENYDAEGGDAVIGCFPRVVEHYPVGFLQGRGVEAKGDQGRHQGHDQVRGHPVDPFPYRVWGFVMTRGRRRSRSGQGSHDFGRLKNRRVFEGEEDARGTPGRAPWKEVLK